MRAVPTLASCAVVTLATVATPATAAGGPELQPAPQATIVAAAKACVGTTVDAASQGARFAGWAAAPPEQRKNVQTDGDVLTRDHVIVVYKAAKDGGCVVMAQGDGSFDATSFGAQLGAAVGAVVEPNSKPISLPNGEILIATVSPKTPEAPSNIVLVIANSESKFAKKGN